MSTFGDHAKDIARPLRNAALVDLGGPKVKFLK